MSAASPVLPAAGYSLCVVEMISRGSPAQISDACQCPPVIWFFSSLIVIILYLRCSASAEVLHGGEKEDPRGDWPHRLLAQLYQKREKEAGGFVELLKCDVTSTASQHVSLDRAGLLDLNTN